jgi:hypothetical protein
MFLGNYQMPTKKFKYKKKIMKFQIPTFFYFFYEKPIYYLQNKRKIKTIHQFL